MVASRAPLAVLITVLCAHACPSEGFVPPSLHALPRKIGLPPATNAQLRAHCQRGARSATPLRMQDPSNQVRSVASPSWFVQYLFGLAFSLTQDCQDKQAGGEAAAKPQGSFYYGSPISDEINPWFAFRLARNQVLPPRMPCRPLAPCA
eukprot:718085-Rhodomonas_salina.1